MLIALNTKEETILVLSQAQGLQYHLESTGYLAH